MKKYFFIIFVIVSLHPICSAASSGKNPEVVAKHVRTFIKKGNEAYRNRQYDQAETYYKDALQENPNSELAQFNLALTLLRQQSAASADTLRQMSKSYFNAVTENPSADKAIVEKAFYNLGNISFDEKDYAGSIEMYKEVLRMNPANIKARQNLRVAQIKLKEQQQNKQGQDNRQKDQNQNQDKNDQQDQQNKNDRQNEQQQNQDNKDKKNQQSQPQNNKQKEQPKDKSDNGGSAGRPEISKENADKILKAAAKQEEQTRKKIEKNKNENTGRRITGNPW